MRMGECNKAVIIRYTAKEILIEVDIIKFDWKFNDSIIIAMTDCTRIRKMYKVKKIMSNTNHLWFL
jgi:hypothetical protein